MVKQLNLPHMPQNSLGDKGSCCHLILILDRCRYLLSLVRSYILRLTGIFMGIVLYLVGNSLIIDRKSARLEAF